MGKRFSVMDFKFMIEEDMLLCGLMLFVELFFVVLIDDEVDE